jgi:hypothetical protein
MDLEQFRGLFAVQKRLELCSNEPSVGLKFGRMREKITCHIGLLFPHNGPVFQKCPRLISTDLIASGHQRGSVGNRSEFVGMNGERKDFRIGIFLFANCIEGKRFRSIIPGLQRRTASLDLIASQVPDPLCNETPGMRD